MKVFEKIGEAENKNSTDYQNGLNADIIKTIHKRFPEAVKQSSLIAKQFQGETRKQTVLNVWNFLKKEITYKRDPEGHQWIRLPKRFLSDHTGDCKSFSLFGASILANLGLPVKFRYASYTMFPVPTHIYVVTEDEAGNELILDGVYKLPLSEKQYKSKIDYKMKIATLSGFEDTINGRKKKKGGMLKKLKNKAKQKGLAPARKAFLFLIKKNVHGLGSKMGEALAKDKNAVVKAWVNKGGNPDEITNAIAKGQKHKRILGIGFVAATTFTTALGIASPIIAMISKLFKQLGIKHKKSELTAKPTKKQQAELEASADESGEEVATEKEEIEGIYGKRKHKGIIKKKITGALKKQNKLLLAPQRQVVLKIISLNTNGLATKLQSRLKSEGSKNQLKKIWEGLGGKFEQITKVVESGSKRKSKISGIGEAEGGQAGQYAETAKAASGLIQQIIEFVKDHKKKGSEEVQVGVDEKGAVSLHSGDTKDSEASETNFKPLLIGAAVLGTGYLLIKK